jgi:hypothetical protein
LGQGQQVVAQIGEAERWSVENIVQELGVLAEESDRLGPRLWWKVLRDDLFGLPLSSRLLSLLGQHTLQEGGAAPI